MLRCKGAAGHSGYPQEGESAIHKLVPVLNDILEFEWPSDDVLGLFFRFVWSARITEQFARPEFSCTIAF